jgi:hypothetical protein
MPEDSNEVTKRKIVSEQWYKVIKYEDGEDITIPYPDHRKSSADSPPSTFNGGLSDNEQYRVNAGLPRYQLNMMSGSEAKNTINIVQDGIDQDGSVLTIPVKK